MPSRNSTLAPRHAVDTHGDACTRRSTRGLVRALSSRPRLKPRRDALTRVRHDLRSLVQSVVGYSDLLSTPHYGNLTAEQARFVGHVRSAAEQLQELVDTCIELSRPALPANDQFVLELPEAPLGQVVRRLRNGLVARGVHCDLSMCSSLESRLLTIDIVQLERAVLGLALVLTRDGVVTLSLGAEHAEAGVVLTLRAADAPSLAAPPVLLEQLEDQVGNRDFVRLKLSEVLLSRSDADLQVSPGLDGAVITLHC
jgi:signal transduction histidine kinase